MIHALEFGKYYHIYNRGINSDVLFKEKENYEYFLKLYDKHIDPIADTYAWCLMKNHFHFLIKTKDINELKHLSIKLPSQSFSNLFNAYTKAFNIKYNRHGPLFERPFRRKEVNCNKYFQNLVIYIHNNPVHHLICENPIQYPWSSYVSCVSDKPTKLKRKDVIDRFGDLINFKQSHHTKLHESIPDIF